MRKGSLTAPAFSGENKVLFLFSANVLIVKMSVENEPEANDDMMESIDELKERLSSMKRMMEERKKDGAGTKELFQGHARSLQGTTMIDGNFLSFVFGGSLIVILSVSVYAFYNLYHAVLKKFPSSHTEL